MQRLALMIFMVAVALSPLRSHAAAIHTDVEIFTGAGPIAGSQLHVRFFGDRTLLINGQAAFDYRTGFGIWPADFRDIAGGQFATDDPGFQAFPGTFLPKEQLFYRPLGVAQYWSATTRTWSPAPSGAALRIEGTVPDDIAIKALVFNDPVALQLYDYYTTPTYITGTGIVGPNTKMIDETTATGAFHTHLQWFLGAPEGAIGGPDGAYMVQLQITDPTGKYLDSQPFNVLFNSGLSDIDYTAAFLSRIQPPSAGGGISRPFAIHLLAAYTAAFVSPDQLPSAGSGLVVTFVSSIPEPYAVYLLAAGLPMLLLCKRMRARRATRVS